MSFRITSAWALLIALAVGLSIPLIAETGRAVSEDRNRDGHADLWQYYDEDGDLVRVLRDRNFDGYIDVREVLNDSGVISRSVDQNFDHRFDPGFTERVADQPEVTFNAASQPFLLPRTIFIGDHLIDDRAAAALDPPSEQRSVTHPSGRAPPAAL